MTQNCLIAAPAMPRPAAPLPPSTYPASPIFPSHWHRPSLDPKRDEAVPLLSHRPAINRPPILNRVRVLLVHIPFLSIRGQARLAADVGVSRSTISRLVNGRISPSYHLARAVTDALGWRLGRPLDIRDVFSTDGSYPTPSGCALCGCDGCLPDEAYDADGSLRPEWHGARPSDWSLAGPVHSQTQIGPQRPMQPRRPTTPRRSTEAAGATDAEGGREAR